MSTQTLKCQNCYSKWTIEIKEGRLIAVLDECPLCSREGEL